MPRIQAGDIKINYLEYGSGDNIVAYIHGNLACADWMNIVAPRLPEKFHVYSFDWRGCGDSDKPEPTADFSNYSMKQHATDMINAIHALGIKKCNLANHSTGGIICTHMQVMEPDLFGKVFSLDPVSPMSGKHLNLDMLLPVFQAMRTNRELTFAALAATAPTLFDSSTLVPGMMPRYNSKTTAEQKKAFDFCVDRTMLSSNGIWAGTLINVVNDYNAGELEKKMPEIKHPQLILWGEFDGWIPKADLQEMAAKMPNCKLKIIPGYGHCLNVENPDLYAKYFIEFLS
jgi:non-heme chloroperoxidase